MFFIFSYIIIIKEIIKVYANNKFFEDLLIEKYNLTAKELLV